MFSIELQTKSHKNYKSVDSSLDIMFCAKAWHDQSIGSDFSDCPSNRTLLGKSIQTEHHILLALCQTKLNLGRWTTLITAFSMEKGQRISSWDAKPGFNSQLLDRRDFFCLVSIII